MTKQERKYLRSAYHHFDNKKITYTNTPDTGELAREWRDYKALLSVIFEILCLQGDMDDQTILNLDELFEKHGIKLMD